ncbi:N-acetylmuramoyl-L-alanine amidase [Deinococcus aerolatus]|uniref:N-acetylmuramoyl-L-alanine amidase n=1 Tax=Deinococcus aerolatus TaxID=522487 RepID=A0ABQ2GB05_9DEIO|nr:N-acetylmuramoyl-L-alanine amidase [Deinococcus aerolatus]GGL84088.1 N-acetylmuramoyl-L-alanine amidase [Deinococcus aerolatus]
MLRLRDARPLRFLLRVVALLWTLALLSHAAAAPRVGAHDGFTRLVFDLPGNSSSKVTAAGRSVTVRLNVKLKTEQGALKAAGVTAYAVSGGTVTVTLAGTSSAGKTRVSVLPSSGAAAARLVIDVPTSASAQASIRPAATPIRPASVSAAVTRPRVVLDAGHGGGDPGMTSQWVMEKAVTLDVALRTRAELVKHGVDVVMVRTSDTALSADKRTDLDARSRLATTGQVSAYISIHVNAGGPSAQGIETYYFGQPLAGSDRSRAVQENGGGSVGQELTRKAANSAQGLLGDIVAQAKLSFSRQLAQTVQARLLQYTGAVNRGVQTDAFYVIRNPTTPAILTEIGFGSNPGEGARLATPAYREKIAQGLARAILDFLHTQ